MFLAPLVSLLHHRSRELFLILTAYLKVSTFIGGELVKTALRGVVRRPCEALTPRTTSVRHPELCSPERGAANRLPALSGASKIQ